MKMRLYLPSDFLNKGYTRSTSGYGVWSDRNCTNLLNELVTAGDSINSLFYPRRRGGHYFDTTGVTSFKIQSKADNQLQYTTKIANTGANIVNKFIPNYYALSSSPMSMSAKFFDNPLKPTDSPDYSIISLEDMIPSSSLHPGLVQSQGSIFDSIVSASAQNPGVNKGAVLTIAQRTKDRSSNEIVIFDISNLYYGNRIHPASFELYEKNLTGSDAKIKIRLSDNGRGSLYRSDAITKHAKWNNVGNVFYDEGVAIVKTPHLFFFNKDETNITFKGEQNLHTMILNVPAHINTHNSSSNPTFTSLAPSTRANDEELSTLYVTTVNIHDNNFNIIMKANFAQPIFKTEEDEFIIRLKEDF